MTLPYLDEDDGVMADLNNLTPRRTATESSSSLVHYFVIILIMKMIRVELPIFELISKLMSSLWAELLRLAC